MQRRDFLNASLGASAATLAAGGLAPAQAAVVPGEEHDNHREHYEWRTYHLADKSKQTRVVSYLQSAAFPAWKRIGLGPTGAFRETGPDATPSVHVLLTYPSSAMLASARLALEADDEYKKAAAEYLAAKRDNPAFDRVESTLLVAFKGHPHITPPKQQPRVLELRTYENHGEDRARAKINMFDDGEIGIFPNCGFENVFFGESLIGPALPNLKYMLAAPDLEANAAGWKTFIANPDFLRMKDDPKYADTEPKITKVYLTPTDYSEV